LVDLISERRKLKKKIVERTFFSYCINKDSMEKPFPFDIDETDNEPFETSTQCGNFRIFVSPRFYVKSVLWILEVQKLLVSCYFRACEFCSFGNFQPTKSEKILENCSMKPLDVLKWLILHF